MYRIENPVQLITRTGGTTHRVVDSIGVVHCLPAPGTGGCILRWKSKDESKPVSFYMAVETCAGGVMDARQSSQTGGGGSTPTPALFIKSDYWVKPISHSLALALVREHHYSKGGSLTAVYTHGLFRRDKPHRCLGVAWWLPPTPACGKKVWPEDCQKVLSLSRLVLVPGLPKNAAVYLLMNSVRLIKKRGDKWRCLVTFADTWRGHTGHIYRVAGWEDLGLGKPDDVWTSPDGVMVSRKAGPKTRSRQEMINLGYICQGKFSKHRFRLILPEPKSRREPSMFDSIE